ncbi:MAG: IPT/TIG domain-containing protein, partial [Flexibacteraceae bacterium]
MATIAGTVVSTNNFTVILPPVITSFTPLEGVPGDTITVTGTDLSSVTNVAIGTTFATNIVLNTATSLRFIVPVGASTAQIRVTTGFGATSSVDPFTVIQAPQITSFTPSSGSVGANVTITGLNLLNAIVRFNGVLVTSLTTSNNSISAQVPSGATTGFITVTNRAGSVSATTPFIVNGAGPIITSFDPAQAAVGSNVLVSGANFTGATNILIGGTRATATFAVISDNQIRFTVPAGTTDGPIIVFTPNGSDTSNTNFRVSAPLFTFPGCASTPVVNGGRIFPLQNQRTETVAPGSAYFFKFFASRDSAYMFSTCRSGLGNGNDLFLRIFRSTDLNNPVATNDDNGPVCSGF